MLWDGNGSGSNFRNFCLANPMYKMKCFKVGLFHKENYAPRQIFSRIFPRYWGLLSGEGHPNDYSCISAEFSPNKLHKLTQFKALKVIFMINVRFMYFFNLLKEIREYLNTFFFTELLILLSTISKTLLYSCCIWQSIFLTTSQ